MPTKIPKFSHAHFRKFLYIFDANLAYFLPELKIYCLDREIMEKLWEFLAEIPGGDKPILANDTYEANSLSFRQKFRFVIDRFTILLKR